MAVTLGRLEGMRDDLDAIDRASRVFDPTISPGSIRAVVKRRGRKLFRHGELHPRCAGHAPQRSLPITAHEIADRLVVDYRLDMGAAGAVQNLRRAVHCALNRHKGRTLASTGIGLAEAWMRNQVFALVTWRCFLNKYRVSACNTHTNINKRKNRPTIIPHFVLARMAAAESPREAEKSYIPIVMPINCKTNSVVADVQRLAPLRP